MKLIPELRSMLAYINQKTAEIVTPRTDDRVAVATSLYEVAHDHAQGICILLENGRYPSAYALIRTHFETFIRATWILHCATDKEIRIFTTEDRIGLEQAPKKRVSFDTLVKAVEKSQGWPDTLSNMRKQLWPAMNSYTHGGLYQVTRIYDGKTVDPRHGSDQVDSVCQLSGIIAFLSFAEMVELSGDIELDKCVGALYEQYRTWVLN